MSTIDIYRLILSVVYSIIYEAAQLEYLQYCEYHPNYAKAKEWMEKNLSDELQAVYLGKHVIFDLRRTKGQFLWLERSSIRQMTA